MSIDRPSHREFAEQAFRTAFSGVPVLVRCKSQHDADRIYAELVRASRASKTTAFPRERTIWIDGSSERWIRVRYIGQESPGDGVSVLEWKGQG